MDLIRLLTPFFLLYSTWSNPIETNLKTQPIESSPFFSLNKISNREFIQLKPPQFLFANDGVKISFRKYLSVNPQAIAILFHGGGAHNGLSYQYLASDLSSKYHITVYTPDLRGHGESGGKRGDTSSKEQVWVDISTMIDLVQKENPNLPVYLVGHSSGAGLLLNYSSWSKAQDVRGYIFLAPYFGYKSNTKNQTTQMEFTKVDTYKFIINKISFGLLYANSPAVHFNYPKSIRLKHPNITTSNSVNMAYALTPQSPSSQLNKLGTFALWIGSDDEVFDPQKVMRFAMSTQNSIPKEKITQYPHKTRIETIEGADHLSILVVSADRVASWIKSK